MSTQTGIEWCDHTFNLVIGCHPVSPGCANCYARDIARNRMQLDVWDDKTAKPRKTLSPAYWKQPLTWERKAIKEGRSRTVFCSSMADGFEKNATVAHERAKLWPLIEATPHLDWLLLTKRPGNVMEMIPDHWRSLLPKNVWIGTSVENQHWADVRIPLLIAIPAHVRFLSCGPLLGLLNLSKYFTVEQYAERKAGPPFKGLWPDGAPDHHHVARLRQSISWVIAEAESGAKARPMDINWVRALRDQCQDASVSFFFKQDVVNGKKQSLPALDGKVWAEFPFVN